MAPCRRRRRGSPTTPTRIPLPLVAVAMVTVVAVAPSLATAAAVRGTDTVGGILPARWSGPFTGSGDGVRGRGRDLRVAIIHDVVDRDKAGEGASGGEEATEPEADVASGDTNATTTQIEIVDVDLPPFSLVLDLDVSPVESPSGGRDDSAPAITAEDVGRNDGGEDEYDPSSTTELLNHTIVEEVETLTALYLRDQLSVLLPLLLPPSVLLDDVVLNLTSFEVLPSEGDGARRRERRRVLRTWLVAKAANNELRNDTDEGEGGGEQISLRIKLYFEGFVRLAVTMPAPSSNSSTTAAGRLPGEATLRMALRTALSGSRLNDPDDDGSLLNLLRNGGIDDDAEAEGDGGGDGDGSSPNRPPDAAAIELSGVTEITARLESPPPPPPRPLTPGPVPPPTAGGAVDADGTKDTNATAGDHGADDDQTRPQPPSQGGVDAANGNATAEEDGGPSPGGGAAPGGSNATAAVGTEGGEREEQGPVAGEDGGPASGGANATATNTTVTEVDGEEEGKQEHSGNTTIGGRENATVDGTIGHDGEEVGDSSPPPEPTRRPHDRLEGWKGGGGGDGDDASTGAPPPEDQPENDGGGGPVMTTGIIAVLTVAAVAVVGEVSIMSITAYRGRRRKLRPPAAGGVDGDVVAEASRHDGDHSSEQTMIKVHVAGGDLPGGGAGGEQRAGRSFDTFDSDATSNTIDVAAAPGAVAVLGTGGAGDDGGGGGEERKLAHDFTGAISGGDLDAGLDDRDVGGVSVGGGEKRGRSHVELVDGLTSSVVDPLEKESDVAKDRLRDDGSTKMRRCDEGKNNADAGDVVKEDRVDGDDVVGNLNDGGGTETELYVSENVEADIPATAYGIEFEAATATALAGGISSAAAAEATKLNADDTEEDEVAGTTEPPSADASRAGERDPPAPENATCPPEGSTNGGASNLSSGPAKEHRQDDGSTRLPLSDEGKNGADAGDDNDVVGSLNDSGGTETELHVSEKVEDGKSADTPAAAGGIQFEAAAAAAGGVSPAAAGEATKLNADDKEEDEVAGTTEPPSADASLAGERDPTAPENAPCPPEGSMNGGASNLSSGPGGDVAGCTPSSSSSPFERVCQSTSSGAPSQEGGVNATAIDTVTHTSSRAGVECSDDNPGDDVLEDIDTTEESAAETGSAVQGPSSSPLPPALHPHEPQQRPFIEPEHTGADRDASHRSNPSSSWSNHADEVASEVSSGMAASSLHEGREEETDMKERERSEGGVSGEEKKTATTMKRTLSQLSPQRLVRKARLLRKSSTSSSIGKTPPFGDEKKKAGRPIDPPRPHDDDSSSGYVDSSVGAASTDHHKDCRGTHHHGEDSSFDDDSAYAYSEGSGAWSYDRVAHPTGLPRGSLAAAANDASVTDDVEDAALDQSKPLRRSTPSLMVELPELV